MQTRYQAALRPEPAGSIVADSDGRKGGRVLEGIFDWIIATVHEWGYGGIVIMMAVESTILPFPSEAALIPAGYLAAQGKMDPFISTLCGAGGSLLGASLNYLVSMWLGRPIMERIGG